MGSALQFAELREEDGPRLGRTSYVTTVSHHTFEHMPKTHGKSLTSSFLLYPPFSDALCLLRGTYLDFPSTR